jgi:hypothetical protein
MEDELLRRLAEVHDGGLLGSILISSFISVKREKSIKTALRSMQSSYEVPNRPLARIEYTFFAIKLIAWSVFRWLYAQMFEQLRYAAQGKPVTIGHVFTALPCHDASANRFSRVAEGLLTN